MDRGARRRRSSLRYHGCRGRWRDEDVDAYLERGSARARLFDRGPGRDLLVKIEHDEPVDEGPVTRTHWVEIVMVGEDDNPIGGLRYEIELPDGSIRRGRLSLEGSARVDGITTGGNCKVRFPELDEDAWRPLR